MDVLQQILWCVYRIKLYQRSIKHPRHPTGLIVAELDARIELDILLRTAGAIPERRVDSNILRGHGEDLCDQTD